jgi:hypothetical protein
MRYVVISRAEGNWPGNNLDPEPYLRVLPELLPQLPLGAREFAGAADHYDFTAVRCVKDLQFGSLTAGEAGAAQISMSLRFAPNPAKHDAALTVRYLGVSEFRIDVKQLGEKARVWPESRRLGDLQLDEILPVDGGCTHEIQLTGGHIFVRCTDLVAEWETTAGP